MNFVSKSELLYLYFSTSFFSRIRIFLGKDNFFVWIALGFGCVVRVVGVLGWCSLQSCSLGVGRCPYAIGSLCSPTVIHVSSYGRVEIYSFNLMAWVVFCLVSSTTLR